MTGWRCYAWAAVVWPVVAWRAGRRAAARALFGAGLGLQAVAYRLDPPPPARTGYRSMTLRCRMCGDVAEIGAWELEEERGS